MLNTTEKGFIPNDPKLNLLALMNKKFTYKINVDEIVTDIKENPNSIIFLFGDKLQGKTFHIETIKNEIIQDYRCFNVKLDSSKNILEICYLTALCELLENVDDKKYSSYSNIFKSDELFLFSKVNFIRNLEIRRLKKILLSKKKDLFIQYLERRYRGINEFSLRYVLYEVLPINQKVCFFIDDFDNYINNDVVKELAKMNSDEFINSFLVTSRPKKQLQNHFDTLIKECKKRIKFFYINPYIIHTQDNDITRTTIPIIPGIFTDINPNDISEHDIYDFTINNSYYKSIYSDDLISFEDGVICAFLLTTNGLRENEIKEILKLRQSSQNKLSIKNHNCIWKIDSEWRFIDSWREYVTLKENIDSIIDKSETFLIYFILFAFKYPEKVKNLDLINKDFDKSKLNKPLSKYIADYIFLVKKLAIHKRKDDKISSHYIYVIKDFLLQNSLKGFNDLYDLLWCVYDETQEKNILDYILQSIAEDDGLSVNKASIIIERCLEISTKWNDITLLNNIKIALTQLKSKGIKLNIKIQQGHKLGLKNGLPTIVILTAKKVEYKAVRKHLTVIVDNSQNDTFYETGIFEYAGNQIAKVTIRECGETNMTVAQETERAIQFFRPECMLFIGVAGSRKPQDFTIGDVIFPIKIYSYEGGKSEKGFFRARPDHAAPTYILSEIAKRERLKSDWKALIKNDSHKGVKVKADLGVIASGEQVVEHSDSVIGEILTDYFNDTSAVEMEGFGFAKAATRQGSETSNMLIGVVRGISNIIGQPNEHIENQITNRRPNNMKAFASDTASAFAYWLIYKYYG